MWRVGVRVLAAVVVIVAVALLDTGPQARFDAVPFAPGASPSIAKPMLTSVACVAPSSTLGDRVSPVAALVGPPRRGSRVAPARAAEATSACANALREAEGRALLLLLIGVLLVGVSYTDRFADPY